MRSPVVAASLVLISLAGCRCEPTDTMQGKGEIGIIYELDGFMVSRPNGVYDFRGVAMGVTRTLKVTIKNEGSGALDLETLERISGDEALTIAFERQTVGGADSVELTASFVAPVTDEMQKAYTAKFRLTAANTEPGRETAEIELKALAVKAECLLPDTIDFGGVAVGATETRTVRIANLTSFDDSATLGDITSSSGDAAAFRYGPGWLPGSIPLVPGSTRDVTFRFAPTQSQTYSAFVTLKPMGHCPSTTVKLIGSGVTAAVECAPLDFAFLPTGLTKSQDTTLTNHSLQDVTLTAMVSSTNDFSPAVQMVTVPKAQRVMQSGSLTLVPGTATLRVEFRPTRLGPLTANVSGDSSLAAQPRVACAVQGQGGGPDIDLKPSSVLDFGGVPYFAPGAGPEPFFVTRKVTVQNLGTASTDPRANLKLGMNGALGQYFKVTPKNAQTSAGEICVGVYDGANPNPLARCSNAPPIAYDPQLGLPASGVSGLLDIPVRITPDAPNKTMEWELEVYSNDPDEPVVKLTIRAASISLTPCLFSVTPANLQFGLVTPPQSRDLSFTIKNLGAASTETCLLTHLGLAPGADATFSLPDGELSQVSLAAGGTVTVRVRATGSGLATSTLRLVQGAIRFGISSPTRPQVDLPLTAQIGLGCLTIAPADLDFGTVKQGCDSSRRVFTVYNTCRTDVTINDWRMAAAAGQPIGGPNCMNASAPCPEFTLDGVPSFAKGSVIPPAAAMPSTFALKYHPIDLGRDTGAFTLDVTQNGGSRTEMVVTLSGTGDNAGLNVDTFAQDPRPKADILWIIDSSCSMYDKQQLLSQNFASVVDYANNVVPGGIDWHMGVIDSDPNTQTGGKLRGDATNPKVLRAGMSNVDALFRTKVRVGINGSGNEQFAELAVRALTAPLVNTDNLGFLRPDAVLAVIAVTDAGDQSQMPISVVEGLLRNVKGAQKPGQFTYNVIGPFTSAPPPGCIYDDYTDPADHDYLVAAFDGAKGQICDQQQTSFAATLAEIGRKAFGYRDRFFLSSQPDLTQMPPFVVKLDGILMPQTDMTGGNVWTYDPMSNSIRFTSAYVPEPGQTLTVAYHVLCN